MPAESLAEVENLIASQKGIPLVDSTTLFPGIETQMRVHKGKVRDNYYLVDNKMIIVATDRISVFDIVLRTAITGKGIYLTQMTLHWQDLIKDITDNHMRSADVDSFPKPFRGKDELRGRSMLVRRLNMLPAECIVRGYAAGSLWAELKSGVTEFLGNSLPPGLVESDKLPNPIFTPSTKADSGHDTNISFKDMQHLLDGKFSDLYPGLAEVVRDISLRVYTRASEYALQRGIIIADTKFEFGLVPELPHVLIADEILTPDSSRFWPVDLHQPGSPQHSFDKQYVRDYTESTGWNKEYPGPELPQIVVEQTTEKYREAYRRLVAT